MSEDTAKHKSREIIETLASKLYFHGHPINRREARTELGLKVVENVSAALEMAIWDLYLDFETELQNRDVFDPVIDLWKNAQAPPPVAPGVVPTVPIGTTAEINCQHGFY